MTPPIRQKPKGNNMTNIFPLSDPKLMPDPASAELKLDLRGILPEDGLTRFTAMINHCVKTTTPTLYVMIDKATGDGQTLFAPLGQRIKELKAEKIIAYSYPMMHNEALGFYIVFKT
jgi:hypothetical protein